MKAKLKAYKIYLSVLSTCGEKFSVQWTGKCCPALVFHFPSADAKFLRKTYQIGQ
jgi:hypothetical protein